MSQVPAEMGLLETAAGPAAAPVAARGPWRLAWLRLRSDLFGIALVSMVGPSLGVVIGVIAFFSWASVGRIVRGQTISLKEREYIVAARSLGAGAARIMVVEIFPNLVAPVLVYLTLLIPSS